MVFFELVFVFAILSELIPVIVPMTLHLKQLIICVDTTSNKSTTVVYRKIYSLLENKHS